MFEPKRISNLRASVIIPCYNSRDLLKKTLPDAFEALRYKKNLIKEIIIVDDASLDGSTSLIEKEFPKVKLIRHKIRRGLLATINTGGRTAKGNLLVLLGPGTIPKKDFLVSPIRRFTNPKVFGVSLYDGDTSWKKGNFKDGFIHFVSGEKEKKLHETFFVSGSSAVYRRDYWMLLGGLDEKLYSPFYLEDVDLSYRAAKRGLINLWDPEAIVSSKNEPSDDKIAKGHFEKISKRNELLFIWKNISSPIFFRKHIVGLIQRVVKAPSYLRTVFSALMFLKVVYKERNREIKESKLSDEAVFAKFS